MSKMELQRFRILKLVLGGRMSLKEAAASMSVSYRHAGRLRRRLASEGPKGLALRRRGSPAHNRLPEAVSRRIMELAAKRYRNFNDTHMCKMLAPEEGIRLGRETIRRLLRSAGMKPKRLYRLFRQSQYN